MNKTPQKYSERDLSTDYPIQISLPDGRLNPEKDWLVPPTRAGL